MTKKTAGGRKIPKPNNNDAISEAVQAEMAKQGIYSAQALPEGKFKKLWDKCAAKMK